MITNILRVVFIDNQCHYPSDIDPNFTKCGYRVTQWVITMDDIFNLPQCLICNPSKNGDKK